MSEPGKSRLSLLESAGRPPLQAPYADLDLRSIEVRAQRLRAQYLGSLFRRLFDWLERDAQRARQRRIEQYLAGATDLADVEHRMRVLAHRGAGDLF
jgi:Protein of unknown function (DUF3563)